VVSAPSHETLSPGLGNGATTTCTITGLTNGQAYQVTVVSVGRAASGYSAPSEAQSFTPQVPPGVPVNVKVTAGVKSLSVQWTAGAGGPAGGFTATATGGATPLTCTAAATASTCTFSGVTPGAYTVTVVAGGTQPGIKSAPSAPVQATVILAAAPTLPTSPTPATSTLMTASATSVKAGGTVTLGGTGFAPYTQVALAMYTGAVKFDSVVTDATGAFTTTVTIPSGTPAGAKTIIAGGLPPTGATVRYLKAAITVVAAPVTQVVAMQRAAEYQLTR